MLNPGSSVLPLLHQRSYVVLFSNSKSSQCLAVHTFMPMMLVLRNHIRQSQIFCETASAKSLDSISFCKICNFILQNLQKSTQTHFAEFTEVWGFALCEICGIRSFCGNASSNDPAAFTNTRCRQAPKDKTMQYDAKGLLTLAIVVRSPAHSC